MKRITLILLALTLVGCASTKGNHDIKDYIGSNFTHVSGATLDEIFYEGYKWSTTEEEYREEIKNYPFNGFKSIQSELKGSDGTYIRMETSMAWTKYSNGIGGYCFVWHTLRADTQSTQYEKLVSVYEKAIDKRCRKFKKIADYILPGDTAWEKVSTSKAVTRITLFRDEEYKALDVRMHKYLPTN